MCKDLIGGSNALNIKWDNGNETAFKILGMY